MSARSLALFWGAKLAFKPSAQHASPHIGHFVVSLPVVEVGGAAWSALLAWPALLSCPALLRLGELWVGDELLAHLDGVAWD